MPSAGHTPLDIFVPRVLRLAKAVVCLHDHLAAVDGGRLTFRVSGVSGETRRTPFQLWTDEPMEESHILIGMNDESPEAKAAAAVGTAGTAGATAFSLDFRVENVVHKWRALIEDLELWQVRRQSAGEYYDDGVETTILHYIYRGLRLVVCEEKGKGAGGWLPSGDYLLGTSPMKTHPSFLTPVLAHWLMVGTLPLEEGRLQHRAVFNVYPERVEVWAAVSEYVCRQGAMLPRPVWALLLSYALDVEGDFEAIPESRYY